MPKKGGLGQFADLRGGGLGKKEWGVFDGGAYPNLHYKLGNNFNCDFNLLMAMSLLLITNRKWLSGNWLATNNFRFHQEISSETPLYFYSSNLLYFRQKESIEKKFSDFWMFEWKFTKFSCHIFKLCMTIQCHER